MRPECPLGSSPPSPLKGEWQHAEICTQIYTDLHRFKNIFLCIVACSLAGGRHRGAVPTASHSRGTPRPYQPPKRPSGPTKLAVGVVSGGQWWVTLQARLVLSYKR